MPEAKDQEVWYEGMNHAEDDEEDDEDTDDHPRPCNCGQIKCVIIAAALERYKLESVAQTMSEEVPTLVDFENK